MAAKNFATALAFTLSFEGGWADNPYDPGGATMRGVTLRTFRRYHPGASAWNLRNAPINAFETIYRKEYWEKIGADALPPGVDLMAFDIGVNMGVGRIAPWLRQTANLGPVERIHALGVRRVGFWRSLRIFRKFGTGWLRREAGCLKASMALT